MMSGGVGGSGRVVRTIGNSEGGGERQIWKERGKQSSLSCIVEQHPVKATSLEVHSAVLETFGLHRVLLCVIVQLFVDPLDTHQSVTQSCRDEIVGKEADDLLDPIVYELGHQSFIANKHHHLTICGMLCCTFVFDVPVLMVFVVVRCLDCNIVNITHYETLSLPPTGSKE
jgi:hypothetical protein